MNKLDEGGMALNKHAHVERKFERLSEFGDTFGLRFAAAIGEENKGNPIPLQEPESFLSSWERVGAAEQHAINAGGALEVHEVQRLMQRVYSKANAKSGILAWLVEGELVT